MSWGYTTDVCPRGSQNGFSFWFVSWFSLNLIFLLLDNGMAVLESGLTIPRRIFLSNVSVPLFFLLMLISPCNVNQFLKMFQKDDTFCIVFYSLQTVLHVSGETFTHHQELE
jgi:hypothetical protein